MGVHASQCKLNARDGGLVALGEDGLPAAGRTPSAPAGKRCAERFQVEAGKKADVESGHPEGFAKAAGVDLASTASGHLQVEARSNHFRPSPSAAIVASMA